MKNFDFNFTVQEPQNGKIIETPGDYAGRIAKFYFTNSHVKKPSNGEMKSEAELAAIGYTDPTHQLCITYVANENAGAITERYSLQAFTKFADLSDEEKASGKWINVEGYAVDKAAGTRVVSEEGMEGVQNIISRIALAVGIKAGAGINGASLSQAMTMAIENKLPVGFRVKKNDYGRLEVTTPWALDSSETVEEKVEAGKTAVTVEDEDF